MIRYLIVGLFGAAVGAVGKEALYARSHAAADIQTTVNDSVNAAAGILALHRADSIATISGDPNVLTELWDSAAVRIVPGRPATVSKAAIFTEDSTSHAHNLERHIIEYSPHFLGTAVSGNQAVEWGYFRAKVVTKSGAKPDSGRGNVLRVMRRQADGTWKFTHVILNSAQ